MSDMTETLAPKRRPHNYRHGHTKDRQYTPTYQSWQSMLARCRYLHRDITKKHGGRGIAVCDRWMSYDSFLADMGERPAGTALDRIDNNDDYTPANCRWASPREQARNRRTARLTFDKAVSVALARLAGESCPAIAKRYGISESLPREIVRGRTWPDALAEAKRRIADGA